jgi:hypothetical protein
LRRLNFETRLRFPLALHARSRWNCDRLAFFARLVDQGDLMTVRIIGAAAALVTLILTTSVSAQTSAPAAGASPAASPAQSESAKPARRSRAKSTAAKGEKKEPTVGQMAARERQRKCAAEWKTAKAGGKIADGMKWPKYWSQCNARLKGNAA